MLYFHVYVAVVGLGCRFTDVNHVLKVCRYCLGDFSLFYIGGGFGVVPASS